MAIFMVRRNPLLDCKDVPLGDAPERDGANEKWLSAWESQWTE
jgi:hypothetical protein